LEEIDEFARQIRVLALETTKALNATSNQKKSKEELEQEKEQRDTIDLINKQLSALKDADRSTQPNSDAPSPPIASTSELYQQFKKEVQEAQEDLDETERMMETETNWPDQFTPDQEIQEFRPKANTTLYRRVKDDFKKNINK
jgi:chromosome segregation ATPase